MTTSLASRLNNVNLTKRVNRNGQLRVTPDLTGADYDEVMKKDGRGENGVN